MNRYWLCVLAALLVFGSCSRNTADENGAKPNVQTEEFVPYNIGDSTQFKTYANGVQVYTVLEGPGQFPRQNMSIQFNYHGMLMDGKVFDSSFNRGEPLKIRLGEGEIIQGLEYALQKMRFGTKAVVVIPPELAYKDREDVPDIPPNSTLAFHVDILGAF